MKKIIGLCGVARCGKDTFFKISQKLLQNKVPLAKHSFAFALKQELDMLCKEQLGFSSFTEDSFQKELIRETLASWGQLRRLQNPLYWVEKIQNNFIEGINFITDVRFENEINFIKNNGGKIIFIHRTKNSVLISPANETELKHTLPLRALADHCITWDTVEEDIHLLDTQVKQTLTVLLDRYPPHSV